MRHYFKSEKQKQNKKHTKSGKEHKGGGGGEEEGKVSALFIKRLSGTSVSQNSGVRSEGKLCTNIKSVLRYRTELGNTHQCDETQGNNSTQALSTKKKSLLRVQEDR